MMVRMELGVKRGVSQEAARCDKERQPVIKMRKRDNKRRFKRQNMGRRRPSTESREQLGSVVMGLIV